MLIQIFISLFCLFAFIKTIGKFKRQNLPKTDLFLWLFLWLAAGITVWLPGDLTKFANFLGIGRGADLILYISILLVFYLFFRLYIRLEKIEKNITKIVQKNALENHNNEE